MSKKSRKARNVQPGSEKSQVLTDKDLKQVSIWKARIETNVQDAAKCYRRMDENDLLADKDLLAALARYVENTGEAITKLDDLTHGEFFAMLVEVPVGEDGGGLLSWKNLKGIRIRLAHKFWDIDSGILIDTVRKDFPVLERLFTLLWIYPTISRHGTFTLNKSAFARLVGPGDIPALGDYVLLAVYGDEGWHMLRASLIEEPKGYISGIRFSTASQPGIDSLRFRGVRLEGKGIDAYYPSG